MASIVADKAFLLAFDESMAKVFRHLAASGLADDAIWEAFRKATIAMAHFAHEIENGDWGRGPANKVEVVRRPAGLGGRKIRAASQLSRRYNKD